MGKNKPPCPWCHFTSGKTMKKHQIDGWSVIDDYIIHYVSPELIHFCPFCGRNIDDERRPISRRRTE